MKKLSGDKVESLKSKVKGQVITTGDAEYDEARKIWNAMIDKKPGQLFNAPILMMFHRL